MEVAKPVTGKKPERKVLEIAGIEEYAQLDAVGKLIDAAKKRLSLELEPVLFGKFVAEIKKNGGKAPESFDGVEGHATANIQLKKRTVTSALNEDEQKILKDAGIKPHRSVVTPKLYAINPAYVTDEELLKKAEKAFAKADLPEDFFVVQEERAMFVVDDTVLDKVMKSTNKELIKIATSLAIKPSLDELVAEEALATIGKFLGVEEEPAKPARKAKK